MATLHDELRWRGLLFQETDGCEAHLAKAPVTGYCGFDPTAESLHVGNLVSLMGLVRLAQAGHRAVALVGGGTAMIGDPSGKSEERPMRTPEEIASNAGLIWQQIQRVARNALGEDGLARFDVRNNAEWLHGESLIGFLRDVGKHFTVNWMMQKDSVKSRMETGISFTEFSYMLLQAYDFARMHAKDGVSLQIGGSDQWGNITAGIELIRRMRGAEAHALTFPLLTTASGTKFGKTEAGAVWLDPERTSPYRFYQFWINADDRDVGQLLRTFTFLERGRIEALDRATADKPEAREAQRVLARDITERVHGADAVHAAEEVSQLLFGKGDPRSLSKDALSQLAQEIPAFTMAKADPDTFDVIDAISTGKDALFKSKSEARRALEQGGLYVNGERIGTERVPIARERFLHGRYLLARKGARSYGLLIVKA